MAKLRSQIGRQLTLIGTLAARWNDLEGAIRFLAAHVAPDSLTANMLIVDMQAGQLVTTTRMLADEMEHFNKRTNASLLEKKQKGIKVKLYEPMFEHVDFLLDCFDTLREYRNYYVHGVVIPKSAKYLTVTSITARKGVSFHQRAVNSEALEKLIRQIDDFLRYVARLIKAIKRNNSMKTSERPTWPKRPPVPDKLSRHRTNLRDVLFPPLSSDE